MKSVFDEGLGSGAGSFDIHGLCSYQGAVSASASSLFLPGAGGVLAPAEGEAADGEAADGGAAEGGAAGGWVGVCAVAMPEERSSATAGRTACVQIAKRLISRPRHGNGS